MYHAFMRTVTVDDADELAELDKQLFPNNCLNEFTLAREIALGSGWCFVEAGDIVAYILCRGDSYLTDIMRLGVLPAYEGRGLGRSLLLRGMMTTPHTMLTVATDNTRALRLYHHLGFEIVGRLLGDSAWVMGKAQQNMTRYFIGLDR